MVVLDFLRKYPFLFFILPFAIGIVFTDFFFYRLESSFDWPLVILLSLILPFLLLTFNCSYPLRWLFGVVTFVSFLFLGIGGTFYSLSETIIDWSSEKEFYFVRVTEDPREKENSFLCPVIVESMYKDKIEHEILKKVNLYVLKDPLSQQIKCGDQLIVYSRITAPQNNGNPGEFDYKHYLYRQGVSGTGVAFSGQWKLLDTEPTFNIKESALRFRKKLLSKYESLGVNENELGVLSAISLGYRDYLSEDIKSSYSITGTSHVLALSGLHIGILFFLLTFLGSLIFSNYRLRILKALFILMCLWGFAFISGLSPSIVRAVCMCSGVIIFQLISRTSLSFHLLTLTAFLMLLYNPFYLFDISFQLSFVSVASILLMYPWLHSKVKVKNRLLDYVWSLFAISLIAQVGTMPIVIYYFGTFPVYSLVSNVLVVPLITLLLYMVVVFWLFTFSSFLQGYIIIIINKLIYFINFIVSAIEKMPFSSVKNIGLHLTQVYGYYLILIMLLLFVMKRDIYQLRNILLTLLIIGIFHSYRYVSNEVTPSLVFYNTRSTPAVHLIESKNNGSVILGEGNEEIPLYLESIIQRFCLKKQIAYPTIKTLSKFCDNSHEINRVVRLGNKTVCFLTGNYWNNKTTDHPLTVDYLYMNKDFKGKIKDLLHLFNVENVILDSSITDYRIKEIREECKRLNISFHCLCDGALVVNMIQ